VILIVAGFGIYNILNVVVNQKKKEIAILRSMGFTASDVKRLFLTQGVFLGVVGGLIGLLFGFLVSKYMATLQFAGGPEGGAGLMPISFKLQIYFMAMGFANFVAILASYLPASAASKLTPIQIIREGAE
jgi:lipoprotein-releasing system permease protein